MRIDFYRHERNLWGVKTATLLFFNVFNTSFYADKTHIRFPKKKLDILSKDKENKKVPSAPLAQGFKFKTRLENM